MRPETIFYLPKWLEQTAPVALLIGLLLGLIFNPRRLSLLQIARDSKQAFFGSSFHNRLFARLRSFYLGFWILLISAMIGAFVYFLLDLSSYYFLWLHLLLQILFAWQAFPMGDLLKRLFLGRKKIMQIGTVRGLNWIRQGLEHDIKSSDLPQFYDQLIRNYLEQIVFFWLLPAIIFYFAGWPFLFFYEAFMIQYRAFALENLLVDLILVLPLNLWLTVLRIISTIFSRKQQRWAVFRDNFLYYQSPVFWQEKKAQTTEESDQAELSEVSQKPPEQALRLADLDILARLYLISICLILAVLIVLLYVRAA